MENDNFYGFIRIASDCTADIAGLAVWSLPTLVSLWASLFSDMNRDS